MPTPQQNLQKMGDLLKMMNESLTREEFHNAFREVMKLVLESEKKLIQKVDKKQATAEAEVKSEIRRLTQDSQKTLEEKKKEAAEMITRGVERINRKLAEVDARMAGVRDGQDGKDADEEAIVQRVKAEMPVPSVEDITNQLPQLGERIRDALELLQGDARLDMKAIRGLKEELEKVNERIQSIPRGRPTGMRKVPIVQSVNLTDQVDGATNDFTLPKDTVKVLGVWSTQFPVTFDSDNDFSFSGNTLTINSGTIQSGQTLWALVETLFYA